MAHVGDVIWNMFNSELAEVTYRERHVTVTNTPLVITAVIRNWHGFHCHLRHSPIDPYAQNEFFYVYVIHDALNLTKEI